MCDGDVVSYKSEFERIRAMEFKLISIASIIAFYGCYFVKMFHQKKQGIQTDQIGKNKVGFVKFVEITMKIAAILVFIAGLSSIFLKRSITLFPFGFLERY